MNWYAMCMTKALWLRVLGQMRSRMLRRQNLQPSPTLNEYGAVVSEITIKCKMPCMNSASIPFYRYTGTAATLHNNVMHHHRPLASVSSR